MFKYEMMMAEEKKVTIFFEGDLDIEVTEMMEQEIIPALLVFDKINIDLSHVSFVDSTGIGLLINLIDTIKNRDNAISVTISNVQAQVKDIFDIIQLPQIVGENVFI
jgi:anti-anti-sigma factor